MSWNEAGSGPSGLFEGGFGVGGVLLVVGMVLALAIVSGLGILARMRDRATDRKAAEGTRSSASSEQQRSEA